MIRVRHRCWYSRTVLRMSRLALSVLALLATATWAHADDGDAAIAVLPLEAADERLAIYGLPVAKVLAGKLAQAVDQPVVAWSAGGTLPKRIELVVDGRIVRLGGDAVILEARLRDPGRGQASAQIATGKAPLTQVDRLADELAQKLVIELDRVRREGRTRQLQRKVTQVVEPANRTTADVPRNQEATNPIMLIVADREQIVTDAMAELVRRLGFEPRLASFRDIAGPKAVQKELRTSGARYALLHKVESVDYEWQGVLTARGTVRVVLVDEAGRARYDRMIATDTLVGSRGDRHAALLGFLARQVTDAAWPRLRKAVQR